LGDLSFLQQLPRVSAADAKPAPQHVQFNSGIEPLVRLLEETPRDDLLEQVARRIRGGLGYRDLLAALQLAGVKNIQPRPAVGFKFHAVLVVNSAHLASMASPPSDRWLPIFWALDYFKSSQARDVREGDWTMQPVDEARVPNANKAMASFTQAMDQWDEPAADAAVVGLYRTTGANALFETFSRYGARDYRSIGHKAIFVANAWRTLQCIGWQHAEPVLRSLAYALLQHEGSNPAQRDDAADRPWRTNQELAAQFPEDWQSGELRPAATQQLLEILRSATFEEAPREAVALINSGASPESLWDALFLSAGELLMRKPGIIALHSVTTANALYYAYQQSASDDTRRRLLLQMCSFIPMFRADAIRRSGQLGDSTIDQLEPSAIGSPGDAPMEGIFAQVGSDNSTAAAGVLDYLDNGGDAAALIQAARRLVFLKGDDAHDYKFSSAVLEDFYHLSPPVRNRFLAASVYHLHGTGQRDNPLVQRTRDALDA
jgi:hypothetical protein